MEYDKLEGFMQSCMFRKSSQFVKFGVTKGQCLQISIMNDTDLPITRSGNVDWRHFLGKITQKDFSGNLILELKGGEVVGYAYSQTYTGESLRRLLG